MGAVNFSLDVELADVLRNCLGLEAFVETGTFRGETVEAVKDKFEIIYTVELSQEYYAGAVSKFESVDHVHVLYGDSSRELKKVVADLHDKSTLYFLDAHWCVAENTASEFSQCPLLAELEAIGVLNETSVIIIDDARLFLAPPLAPHETSQWPTFSEVLNQLIVLSDSHHVMVLNDNIVFYPKSADAIMQQYGRCHGVDWLAALHMNRDYDNLRFQFEGLEKQLKEKDDSAEDLRKQLEARGANINDLQEQLEARDVEIKYLQKQFEARGAEIKYLQEQLEASGVEIKDLQKQFEARGAEIKDLQEQFKAKDDRLVFLFDELIAKENVIKEQQRALTGRSSFKFVAKINSKAKNVLARIKGLMRPKLGQLHQYSPKPIHFPKKYFRDVELQHYPSISIVTPSFAQGNFIGRTIKSIVDQNYPNLEYFVQDGGSQDETIEIIKKYEEQLSGWKSEPDNGQSQAINRGMVQTSGEIMAWLNSDDLLLPGSLAYVAEYFSKHPEVDVVYGHRILIDDYDQEIGRWVLPPHDNDVLSWADYVPQETLYWRRRIWEKVGGKVDESFRFAMDWDLILRFRDAGARFVRLPRFLGAFRIHEAQKTSAVMHDTGLQEMDRLRKRCNGNSFDKDSIHKNLWLYMRKHTLCHFSYRLREKVRRYW